MNITFGNNIKIILIYLLFINIVSFSSMYIDKRRAIKKQWRISENNLMLLSIVGGSIGSLLGMYKFRHKTKHLKFAIGFPLILILHIALIIYFMFIK